MEKMFKAGIDWRSSLKPATDLVENLSRDVTQLGGRILDTHLKLAVTGLRRSGKTVFTTCMIHHLLKSYDLPFLNLTHEQRLLEAQVKDFPGEAFPYEIFERGLHQDPPKWPVPTETLSGVRLELRYLNKTWLGSLLSPTQSFKVEILDYPGEWLLDLPLLRMSYDQYCQQALSLQNQEPRTTLARKWKQLLDHGSEGELLTAFRDYLHLCQHEAGLAFIQPGRLIHAFESLKDSHAFCPLPAGHPLQATMQERYERYKTELVEPFFQNEFSSFDRQIVLIDLLSCLNAGPDQFHDAAHALNVILDCFNYGRKSWFYRLFSPRIDKVLFAASKADHVAGNQHANLKQLLELMIKPASKKADTHGISQDVIALASLRATDTVRTEHEGQILSCVKGRLKNEARDTVLFPGEIPGDLPDSDDWNNGIFRFHEFAPRPLQEGLQGQHIRLDQAIEYLLGDKLS